MFLQHPKQIRFVENQCIVMFPLDAHVNVKQKNENMKTRKFETQIETKIIYSSRIWQKSSVPLTVSILLDIDLTSL